jgi:CRP-like cAMP-binding protein/di/tricarboxylate transporter
VGAGTEPDGADVLGLAHMDLLSRVDVFASLDRVELARLAAYLEPHQFADGEVVFHQGEIGDSLYIVSDGRVCVYSVASESGTQTEFATLGPGQYFGEIALILSEPRTASVRAIGEAEVLRLERERFLELIGRNPTVALTVTTKIIGHLRTADAARTNHGGVSQTADLVLAPGQRPRVPRPAPVAHPPSTLESAGRPGLRSGAYLLVATAFGVSALLAQLNGSGSAEVFVLLLGAAAMLWASGLLPFAAVGLGLVATWLVFGIATPQQAMAGFASSSWLFVLSILGLTAALARSGLLFRVGLLMVQRLPAGLAWQASGLLVTGVALGALVPSATARTGLMAPLALAVSQALRQRERGPGAALLGLAGWIGAGPMLFAFLNASSINLMAWGLLPPAVRARTDWIHWFVAVLPLVVVVTAGSLLLLILSLRPVLSGGTPPRRLGLQLAVLGPLQRRERAMLAILAFTLAGWLAGPLVGIQPSTVAVIALLAAFASRNFDRQTLRELNWDYLLFFGVVLGIAEVSTTLGVDQLAANLIGAPLAATGISGPVFVIAIAVSMGLARLFLVSDQAVLLLSLALIPIAPALGVDPFLVVVPLSCMAMVWYMPAQSPEYLLAVTLSEGKLYSHAQSRSVAIKFAGLILVSLVLVMPYWRWLGLL